MKKLLITFLCLFIAFHAHCKWKQVSTLQRGTNSVTILQKEAKSDIRINPDKTKFIKTYYKLNITFKEKKFTIKLPDGFYVNKHELFMKPITFIDPQKEKIYIFISEKTENPRYYGMEGYVYTYDITFNDLEKETIFVNANMGWYPIFKVKNNVLTLQHYLYSGGYNMVSIITPNGYWKSFKIDRRSAKEAEQEYLSQK
ncbi:hypothetical protein EMN47_04075 [Prolixibacteraceae bacterium JC049]|nr:hypothetical protein [Prolixibacteraceae bacterium JC049]